MKYFSKNQNRPLYAIKLLMTQSSWSREMDDKNILESIAKIDKVVILHTSFNRAMQGIEECLIRSKAYSEPIGCLLSGDGGYGKTTLCKVIMQKMPIRTINDGLYEKNNHTCFLL